MLDAMNHVVSENSAFSKTVHWCIVHETLSSYRSMKLSTSFLMSAIRHVDI